mmetsp:Transcript_32388/g.54614  ORF Transcript_32388/g.54614 Transcript_32388/m.54614 type:complete len:179 (+) Transcript_32388:1206-1742(+)
MPTVHFVGEIATSAVDLSTVSITWAIVPGNSAWYAKRGVSSGETHTCETCTTTGLATICHPLDCQYETSSTEGWPLFICEIWDRAEEGFRGFHGCGSAWLPMTPGKSLVEIQLWRPYSSGLEGLSDTLLPGIPDLAALRELTVSPFLRSQLNCAGVGALQLNVTTILSGFAVHGVHFS